MDLSAYLNQETINTVISVGLKAAGVIALLIIGKIIANWLGRICEKQLQKAKVDQALSKFLSKMVSFAVLAFVVISCLGLFGIQTASFAALIAAAGFAIGMALQGTLGHFASGVMLLLFRPFRIGDVISAAGQTGSVNTIDLFTTTLDTPDNRRIIIPNGAIFGSTIENITHHSTRRVDVAVGTDYTADLDETRKVLAAVAADCKNILSDPAPQVVLSDLGASSIDWVIKVWVKTEDYWGVKENVTRSVKIALDKASIGIPFPQMDLHFDSANIMAGINTPANKNSGATRAPEAH